jgi:hypothetical protein
MLAKRLKEIRQIILAVPFECEILILSRHPRHVSMRQVLTSLCPAGSDIVNKSARQSRPSVSASSSRVGCAIWAEPKTVSYCTWSSDGLVPNGGEEARELGGSTCKRRALTSV